ncbi:hypothetical protein [Nostoc sp.]
MQIKLIITIFEGMSSFSIQERCRKRAAPTLCCSSSSKKILVGDRYKGTIGTPYTRSQSFLLRVAFAPPTPVQAVAVSVVIYRNV